MSCACCATLGIEQEVLPHLRPFPNGATAMRHLAAAPEANAIGCTQITEITYTPGLTLAGPLPAAHGLATVYAAAVRAGTAHPAAAQTLVALLTGPASREPASGRRVRAGGGDRGGGRMSMRRVNRKDFLGGGLMLLLGLGAAFQASHYDLGSLSRMGPGYFPLALGLILAVTGVLIMLASLGTAPAAPAARLRPEWRGWLCICAGVAAFAVLGRYGGLLPATFVSVFVAALGDRKNSPARGARAGGGDDPGRPGRLLVAAQDRVAAVRLGVGR